MMIICSVASGNSDVRAHLRMSQLQMKKCRSKLVESRAHIICRIPYLSSFHLCIIGNMLADGTVLTNTFDQHTECEIEAMK